MTKKLYFLMAMVVSVGCLCGLSACGDDNDEPQSSNSTSTCTCTIKYKSGDTITTTVDPSVYGYTNCSQVAHELANVNTGASVSCR